MDFSNISTLVVLITIHTLQGILVHTDSLPTPASYGTHQTCSANVPWTNEIFYYAIVALDERGNRGQISNIVTVYIHEVTTTTVTTTTAKMTSAVLVLSSRNKKWKQALDFRLLQLLKLFAVWPL